MANSKRGICGPCRVVVVGLSRQAKGQHERAPLVIAQHLVERAVKPIRFFLCDDRGRVQSRKIGRCARINRREPHEHGARIAKLRKKIGMTAKKAVAHQRQHQLLDRFAGVVFRRDLRGYAGRVLSRQSLYKRNAAPPRGSPCAPSAIARHAGAAASTSPARASASAANTCSSAGPPTSVSQRPSTPPTRCATSAPAPIVARNPNRASYGGLPTPSAACISSAALTAQARGRAQVRALVLEECYQRVAGEQQHVAATRRDCIGEDAVMTVQHLGQLLRAHRPLARQPFGE